MRKSWVWQLSERKAFPSIDENNTNIMPKGIAHNRCTMILTIFCVNICYQGSKKNNLDSTFVIALFLFTRIFSLWSFRFGRRKRNLVISKQLFYMKGGFITFLHWTGCVTPIKCIITISRRWNTVTITPANFKASAIRMTHPVMEIPPTTGK